MQAHNLIKSTIQTLEKSVTCLKMSNKDIRAVSLDMKTLKSSHRCCCGVFIVNFEHISFLSLVFLLLTLNR